MKPKPFRPEIAGPEIVDNAERYWRDGATGLFWHRSSMRPLYADTDRSTVVYHANYLKYFEFGRASLMRDAASNTPYEASETMAIKVQRHMREQGELITRVVGDNVLFAPPLCINAAEVDQMVASATAAVKAVTGA